MPGRTVADVLASGAVGPRLPAVMPGVIMPGMPIPTMGMAGMDGVPTDGGVSSCGMPLPPWSWLSGSAVGGNVGFGGFGSVALGGGGSAGYCSAVRAGAVPDGIPLPPSDSRALGRTAVEAVEQQCQAQGNTSFASFMSAFRDEMRLAKEKNDGDNRAAGRGRRFVPSGCGRTDASFGILNPPSSALALLDDDAITGSDENEEDFDYWPDEMVPMGVALDNPALEALRDTSPTEETTGSSTTSTAITEGASEEVDGLDDFWPLELLVG